MAITAAKRTMSDQVPDPHTFDTRTHIFDNQGRLLKKNLYVLRVIDGEHLFERPVNSGNLWHANNQPAGRLVRRDQPDKNLGPWAIDRTAPHIEFTAPLTGDEALHYELEQERMKNTSMQEQFATIQRELAAIRGERAVKTPTPKVELSEVIEGVPKAPPSLKAKERS